MLSPSYFLLKLLCNLRPACDETAYACAVHSILPPKHTFDLRSEIYLRTHLNSVAFCHRSSEGDDYNNLLIF